MLTLKWGGHPLFFTLCIFIWLTRRDEKGATQDRSEQGAYEDLDANANKDDTAENGCLACNFVAEGLADVEAAEAESEGNKTDDHNRNESLDEAMVSNGEAYRKSIYGGGNALENYRLGCKLCARAFLTLVLSALVDHLAAYE